MKVVDAWSSYWFNGAIDSFVPKGIENPFEGVWARVADTLQDSSKVLDMACGNGAIAHLLEHAVQDKSLNITGVDIAQVQQGAAKFKQHNVSFESGHDITSLPFEDASFDAVVSQFGIEYSDWQASLNEVARLCKAGGQVCFVMHCKASAIEHNVKQQQQASQAIRDSQFFPVYAEFFELLDEASGGNELALQIRTDETNKKLAEISRTLTDQSEEMGGSQTILSLLEAASDLFEKREQQDLQTQLEQLAAFELMNLAAIERAQSMLDASLDDASLKDFDTALQNLGFVTEVNQIVSSAGRIAFKISGKKHAATH